MRLYGKEAPLTRLSEFRRAGRFPHALMLCGENGVGRRTLAEYAAALILCEKGGEAPCGCCNACMKVYDRIHPDVVYLPEMLEGGKYKVDPLRAVTTDCCKSPNDGSCRVIIFEDADEMNPSCQNALLKFIEEPLPFNHCVFTVENKSAILTTVLSRVVCVNVGEAGHDDCVAALLENGLDKAKAEEMYSLFGGNIGKCLDGANDENAALLFGTASDLIDAVCGRDEYACAAGFASLKKREDIGAVLGLLSGCFGGAAGIICGENARGALAQKSEKLAKSFTLRTAARLYEAAGELSAALDNNPNPSLMSAHCCERIFKVLEEDM